MGKVKELSMIADELKQCSETLDAISSDLLSLLNGNDSKEKVEPPKFEDVRAELAKKSKLGFTPQIKEIITSFGASKLSEVKSENYLALLDKVRGLK